MSLIEKKQPWAPGLEVVLPGMKVICPELNLGQREDNPDLLARWDASDKDAKTVEALAKETVLLALQRNYPHAEAADLREFTMSDLLAAARWALAGPLADKVFKTPGEVIAANGTQPTAAAPTAIAA
jgi:hypothetical protein